MNRQSILEYVNQKFQKEQKVDFNVGDTVRVAYKITEGDTTRIQVFEGTVISVKGSGAARTFTVRKISFGVGVERVFPLNSPNIEKIEIARSGHVRRAKLYYLRARVGRAAKLEEKESQATQPEKGTKGEKKASAAGSPAAPELVSTEPK